MAERKVRRVLVMIDYGEGEIANGEVFDLTALVAEMLLQAAWGANLEISVGAKYETDYSVQPFAQTVKTTISFSGRAGGESVYGASHLDDVVNAAMPDGERVKAIKRRAKRLSDKAEELRSDAMAAKLQQVAAIRHQHPIARFSEPLPQLPTAAQPEPSIPAAT
jgi:hypothetical protein